MNKEDKQYRKALLTILRDLNPGLPFVLGLQTRAHDTDELPLLLISLDQIKLRIAPSRILRMLR